MDYYNKRKFSLRKYHMGLASVAVGITLISGTFVSADDSNTNTTAVTDSGTTNTTAVTDSGTTNTTAVIDSGTTNTTAVTDSGNTNTTAVIDSGTTNTTAVIDSGTTNTTAVTDSGNTSTTTVTDSGNTSTTTVTDSDLKSDNVIVNPKFYDGHNGWNWSSWGDQSNATITQSEYFGETWNYSNGKILYSHGKSNPKTAWTWKLPDPFGFEKWSIGDSVYQYITLPTDRTLTKFEFSAESYNSMQRVKDENGNSVIYADGSGIRVTFYDASGNSLNTYETGPSSSGLMRTLSLENSIPNGATNAKVELLGYAAYPHWIDTYWANVQFYYYSHDTIITNNETKDTTLTVRYHGAGDKTPKNNTQTITWTRTVVMNKTTGEVVSQSNWIPSKSTYDVVITPTIEGYKYDKDKVTETVQEQDLIVDVYYTQNKSPIQNTPQKPIQNTTELSSKVTKKLTSNSLQPINKVEDPVSKNEKLLPSTGETSKPVYVIIGLILVLFSGVFIFRTKSTKK